MTQIASVSERFGQFCRQYNLTEKQRGRTPEGARRVTKERIVGVVQPMYFTRALKHIETAADVHVCARWAYKGEDYVELVRTLAEREIFLGPEDVAQLWRQLPEGVCEELPEEVISVLQNRRGGPLKRKEE